MVKCGGKIKMSIGDYILLRLVVLFLIGASVCEYILFENRILGKWVSTAFTIFFSPIIFLVQVDLSRMKTETLSYERDIKKRKNLISLRNKGFTFNDKQKTV